MAFDPFLADALTDLCHAYSGDVQASRFNIDLTCAYMTPLSCQLGLLYSILVFQVQTVRAKETPALVRRMVSHPATRTLIVERTSNRYRDSCTPGLRHTYASLLQI